MSVPGQRVSGRPGALADRVQAVAKTNYIPLGFREPVYKNLRELVMSYFEYYVSIRQEKILRGYTRPVTDQAYAAEILHTNLSESFGNRE